MRLAAMILAGGRGSRLGASVPKPLVTLGGRTLLEHVLAAVPKTARPIVLNARDGDLFRAFGHPVVSDLRPDFPGPLGGIEAVARSGLLRKAEATHLLVLPGDTPFLTSESLAPLFAAPAPRPRVAQHHGTLQPTVALWPLEALAGLGAFLDAPGRHAIRAYLGEVGYEAVEIGGDDPFFNVNTPDDLAEASRRLSAG